MTWSQGSKGSMTESTVEERRDCRRSSILLGERHTSIFSRFAAKGIDGLLLIALCLILQVVSLPLAALVTAFFSAVQDGFGTGQSIGKRIMGLRVVDDMTGVGCSFRNSFLRNFPLTVAILFASTPVFWALLILLVLPLLVLEIYLLLTLDSGVRLGDVLGNTLVVEYLDDTF